MDADAFFSQYRLGKSIKRKTRRISLYFRERDIVSSIAIDADLIEQPIKFLAGFIFVKSNDEGVASMAIFDIEN